jgi:hypothetical protein
MVCGSRANFPFRVIKIYFLGSFGFIWLYLPLLESGGGVVEEMQNAKCRMQNAKCRMARRAIMTRLGGMETFHMAWFAPAPKGFGGTGRRGKRGGAARRRAQNKWGIPVLVPSRSDSTLACALLTVGILAFKAVLSTGKRGKTRIIARL